MTGTHLIAALAQAAIALARWCCVTNQQ